MKTARELANSVSDKYWVGDDDNAWIPNLLPTEFEEFIRGVQADALDTAVELCLTAANGVIRCGTTGPLEEALQRHTADVSMMCGAAIRILKETALPQPNVPTGNNPAPEPKQ